jgi:hypothetical protein
VSGDYDANSEEAQRLPTLISEKDGTVSVKLEKWEPWKSIHPVTKAVIDHTPPPPPSSTK